MILSSGAEVTWKQFTKLPQYENLTLNEQVIAYNKYLAHLSNIRNSSINFQNKGRKRNSESPGNPVGCVEGMDVVFLLDYTASLTAEIESIKQNVVTIINTIITQSGGDYRLGLVTFDEYGGSTNAKYGSDPEYTSLPASQRYFNFNAEADKSQWITAFETMSTQNRESFITQLNKLNDTVSIGFGASFPEPGGIGYEQILLGIAGAFRSNVSKLVILITDATPGGDDDTFDSTDNDYLRTLGTLGFNNNVRVLVLSQVAIQADDSYRILADATNGSYTFDSNLAPDSIITAIQDICS